MVRDPRANCSLCQGSGWAEMNWRFAAKQACQRPSSTRGVPSQYKRSPLFLAKETVLERTMPGATARAAYPSSAEFGSRNPLQLNRKGSRAGTMIHTQLICRGKLMPCPGRLAPRHQLYNSRAGNGGRTVKRSKSCYEVALDRSCLHHPRAKSTVLQDLGETNSSFAVFSHPQVLRFFNVGILPPCKLN